MKNVLQGFDPELKHGKNIPRASRHALSESLISCSYDTEARKIKFRPFSCYGLNCNESASPSLKGYLQLNQGHWQGKNEILCIEVGMYWKILLKLETWCL